MSLLFSNGATEYYTATGALNCALPHTVSCWFYPTGTTDGSIIRIFNAANPNQFVVRLMREFGDLFWRESTSGFTQFNYNIGYTPNQWNHMVITHTGGNGTCTAYRNGGVASSGALNISGASGQTFDSVEIGRGVTGNVDSCEVFPYAMSAAEVLRLYTTRMQSGAGPLAWWPLAAGAPTVDASGNGYTLTSAGTTPADGTTIPPFGSETGSGFGATGTVMQAALDLGPGAAGSGTGSTGALMQTNALSGSASNGFGVGGYGGPISGRAGLSGGTIIITASGGSAPARRYQGALGTRRQVRR